MNRITDYIELRDRIVGFLDQYRRDSGMDSFVVGVSGGIDSAVASTLAATTGAPVYALGMPIHQKPEQENGKGRDKKKRKERDGVGIVVLRLARLWQVGALLLKVRTQLSLLLGAHVP